MVNKPAQITSRRSFITNAALTGSVLFFTDLKAIARALNIADYNIKMLTDNIGVFTEKGGTVVFLLNEKGNVVVDAQFPDSIAHLIDEIKKRNSYPFELLINTHHHSDHTSGNIAFKSLARTVVAHQNSKTNQQKAAITNKSEDKQLYPDRVFTKKWKHRVGKEKIELKYFGPAHTNGDIVVHFKSSGVVHIGDLVFNRRYPYIDKPAGANIKNWCNVLDKIIRYYPDDLKFVCGHSGNGFDVLVTKDDMLAFKNYLQKALLYVQEKIAQGLSKDAIIKSANVIPGAEEWKGEGIERTINAAWIELGGK